MFRKALLVFIPILFIAPVLAQSKAPSIEEVVKKFYSNYDVNALSYPQVDFEKRNMDWKITTKRVEKGELINDGTFLFYDGLKEAYMQLPIAAKEDVTTVDYKDHIDDYSIKNYRLHTYYGYNGWYKDVIAELANKTNLSDSALYSLARAYSSYASSRLSNQYGDALKDEIFVLPLARNCMTKEQIEMYKSIAQKAIASFTSLMKQNKNFETIVGNIAIKLANEVMVAFHTYLTYADEYAKTVPLPDKLYPDSIVQKAKNVLMKCPADAVLLSWGDNDFYPILYVQHKLKIRRDVYLLNQNLLALDRYIFMATNKQFDANAIKISVGPACYEGNMNDVFLVTKSASEMKFEDVINQLKSGKRNEYGYIKIPSNNFLITRDSMYKQAGKNRSVTKSYKITIENGYVFKNDWVLLDIFNNLHGRRLCCQSQLFDLFSEMNKYLTKVDENLFVY